MARGLNGSTQYLSNATAPVTGVPLTMAAWAITQSLATSATLISIDNSGLTVAGYRLSVGTTGAVNARQTGQIAASSTMTGLNVWFHAAAVLTSNSSRTAYLNGGGKVTNTTTVAATTGLNNTNIGRFNTSAPGGLFTGSLAEAAVWNAALNDQEIASLAQGMSPLDVRPGSLVSYWPLWGLHSPEIDLATGNRQMTLNAAPTYTTHAPVPLFSRRFGCNVPFISLPGVHVPWSPIVARPGLAPWALQ